jgi:hypothetical protein
MGKMGRPAGEAVMNRAAFAKLVIATGILLGLAVPSRAWCLFNCEPTEADAKAVVENTLRAAVPNAPFQILQFEKTNGRSISMPGIEGYELFYHAVVEFPSGIQPGRSQQNIWNQIQSMGAGMGAMNALAERGFRVTKGNKVDEDTVMESNSSIPFQKTEKGWLGPDGRVY